MNYLKDRESQRELVATIKDMKREEKDKTKIKEPKSESVISEIEQTGNMFSKIGGAIKNFTDGIGAVYKIMVLIVGIVLVVLWISGVISADDIKNIVGFKFF